MALVDINEARGRIEEVGPTNLTDQQIMAIVDVASNAIEQYTSRSFEVKQHEEWLDGNGKSQLYVKQAPLISVDTLEIDGWRVSESDGGKTPGYLVRGDRIMLIARSFRRGMANVHLVYTAGYDVIPASLREACLLTVQAVSTAATMDLNLSGESVPGVYSASYTQGGPGSIPSSARMLLDPFRRVVL